MIIGLSGYAGSGKDTVADILVKNHGYTKIAFADALRNITADIDPWLNVNHDYDRYPFRTYSHWLACGYDYQWLKANTDLRQFLQKLGESVRNRIGEDAWIGALFHTIENENVDGDWVISDVRYPNEMDAILWQTCGAVWRIVRQGVGPANDHISETALDDQAFDIIINNDSTFEALEEYVDVALELL